MGGGWGGEGRQQRSVHQSAAPGLKPAARRMKLPSGSLTRVTKREPPTTLSRTAAAPQAPHSRATALEMDLKMELEKNNLSTLCRSV